MGTAEVEDLVPLGRPFAQQQVQLVVPVEVVLVLTIAQLDPLQELFGDGGVAGGSH
jgi:hypothetical protein